MLDPPTASQPHRDSVVLLVEDNAVNRMVARAMIEELGCQIVDAETGADALMLVSRQRFDLILMDCQMPVIDGFEAARRIRAQEQNAGATRRMPIIALTANAIAGDRERCLAAGMDDYLTKPFSQRTLLAAIARWLPAPDGENAATTAMRRAG